MAADCSHLEKYWSEELVTSPTASISTSERPPSTAKLSFVSPSERTPSPLQDAETCAASSCHHSAVLYDPSPTPTICYDSPHLSTLRLLLAHVGSAIALFLATTDANIISTSLPTITRDLSATRSQYTWVSVAYILTQTACQPLYGRLSDLVGQKNLLYTSMGIFALGSLLCGLAQSIDWLIVCRALAGIGGGGIVSSVWVLTSKLVPEDQRAKWSQALSVTWCCSAIAGPLLGGAFSSNANGSILSWRWGFFLNLPVCLVACVILLISLRGIPFASSLTTWRAVFSRFDFIGLILFMSGTSSLVVGFSFSTEAGWGPATTVPVVVGLIVLVAGGVYELKTDRDPLFPPATFKELTVVIILLISFLHSVAFTIGTFYLVISFQVIDNMTPLQAGVSILPYSLGSSLASLPVAWFIGFWQKRHKNTAGHNWVISAGLFTATLGFGLMIMLNERSATFARYATPLVAGVGIGMLFHAPYQVFTRSLKASELATGTSAFFLARFTGTTIGLAVAGTVFYGKANGHDVFGGESTVDFEKIKLLEPPSTRAEAVHTILISIQMVWVVCTACLCAALIISFLLKTLPCDQRDENTLQEKN